MTVSESGLLPPGLLFLVTVAAGIWLTRLGRPPKVALLTVHKLIALAAVVLAVVALVRAFGQITFDPVALALFAVTGLSAVTLFATGAVLSQANARPEVIGGLRTAHAVLPLIAGICGVAGAYLLLSATH